MIASSALDSWSRGLEASRAGRAVLALGVEARPLARAKPYGYIRVAPILSWSLDRAKFEKTAALPASQLARRAPRRTSRVAVSGDVAGAEVVSRLRDAPAVISAFVAVERAPGSLRRRPWRWPLRIGLLGFDPDEARELAPEVVREGRLPVALVDVRRVEEEPAAVDLLVTRHGLGEATSTIVAAKTLANAVIVVGEQTERWPVVEGLLATIRAASGAIATVLAPSAALATALGMLVREMSHGSPLDVAVDLAWSGEAVLWAEPHALNRSVLPEVSLHLAREARAAHRELAAAAPPEAPVAAMSLEALAREEFSGEAYEASDLAVAGEELESVLESAAEERWLQARVNEGRGELERRLVRGDNEVLTFIGPSEEGALRAGPFDESELPWEEETEAFRLTVVFVSLEPLGEPQSAEIELPRFGRSGSARFTLSVPDDVRRVSARVVVVFRNRILQTAVLEGAVGELAELAGEAALVSGYGGLDERRGFDVALLANRDANGNGAVFRHSWPKSWIRPSAGLEPIADRLADALVGAADLSLSTGLRSKKAAALLVELAVHGRDLFNELDSGGQLGPIAGESTIQVVTAGTDWYLPIELTYEREAPNDGAGICDRFLADPETCGGATCPSASSLDVVCPNAFWGLSKTIERHRFDPGLEEELAGRIVLLGLPREKRRTLPLGHSVFGASTRVREPGLGVAFGALGADAETATSWDAWADVLRTADTHLLVLLPHTNYRDPSLEISSNTLVRGRIEERHVNGGRDVQPVVVLLGCRTAGTRGDPGGFASRFMAKKAAVVFHSLTDLKAGHAAELSSRLATLLRTPARERRSLSELLTQFRRTAVSDGLLAALAISAYGDADWRL